MEEELGNEVQTLNNMLLKPTNTIEINKDAKYYSKLDMDYFYNPETFLNNVNNPLMNPFHSIHGNTYGVFPSGYVKKDSYNHNLTLTNSVIINKIKEENDKLETNDESIFNDIYDKYNILMACEKVASEMRVGDDDDGDGDDDDLVLNKYRTINNDLKNAINTNSKLTLFRKYNVSNIEELKSKYFKSKQYGGEDCESNIDDKYTEFITSLNKINDIMSFNKYVKNIDDSLSYDIMIENAYNKYMNIKR